MSSEVNVLGVGTPVFGQIGWRYYNQIKKKAMEQEFSWAGLGISLSIAFFIVVFSALSLNILYQSVAGARITESDTKIYKLEAVRNGNSSYLNIDYLTPVQKKAISDARLS